MLRRNKAFTLIELLVVVSIIALLVSILMPALAAAREQAQRAVDLAHIRGMTVAWILYADDNDDKLMPGKTRPIYNSGSLTAPDFVWDTDDSAHNMSTYCFNSTHVNGYFPAQTWVGMYDWGEMWIPNGSPTDLEIMAHEATVTIGLMYQYVEDVEVFKCPTVTRSIDKVTYSFVDAMNGHDCFPETNGAIVYTQVSQIPSPSERVVLVCEAIQLGQSWTPFHLINRDLTTPAGTGLMENWDDWPNPHNNGSVFSFADGHAEYHQWQDPQTVPAINSPNSDVLCDPVPFNPIPVNMSWDLIWVAQYCWGVITAPHP